MINENKNDELKLIAFHDSIFKLYIQHNVICKSGDLHL